MLNPTNHNLPYEGLLAHLAGVAREQFELDTSESYGYAETFLLDCIGLKPNRMKYEFLPQKVREYEQGFVAWVEASRWRLGLENAES